MTMAKLLVVLSIIVALLSLAAQGEELSRISNTKSFTFQSSATPVFPSDSVGPCQSYQYTTTLSSTDNPTAYYYKVTVVEDSLSFDIGSVYAVYYDVDGTALSTVGASTSYTSNNFAKWTIEVNCGVGVGAFTVYVIGDDSSSTTATYSFTAQRLSPTIVELPAYNLQQPDSPSTLTEFNLAISQQGNVIDYRQYHLSVPAADNIAALRFRVEATPNVPYTISRNTLAYAPDATCQVPNAPSYTTNGEFTYSSYPTLCDISGDWYVGFEIPNTPAKVNITVSVWAVQWVPLTLDAAVAGVQSTPDMEVELDDWAQLGYYQLTVPTTAGTRIVVRVEDTENSQEMGVRLITPATPPLCGTSLVATTTSSATNLILEDCAIPSDGVVRVVIYNSAGFRLLDSQPARVNFHVKVEQHAAQDIALVDGSVIEWSGWVESAKTTHFAIDTSAVSAPDMTVVDITVFVDRREDELWVALNPLGTPSWDGCYEDPYFTLEAPGSPGFVSASTLEQVFECETYDNSNSDFMQACRFQVPSCLLTQYTKFYLAVRGEHGSYDYNTFFGIPVSFSINIEVRKPIDLIPDTPSAVQSGSVAMQFYDHYRVPVSVFQQGKTVVVRVSSIYDVTSQLALFYNYGSLAGTCPCYSFESYQSSMTSGNSYGRTVFYYDPCQVDNPIEQDLYVSVYQYGTTATAHEGAYNIWIETVENNNYPLNFGGELGVGEHLLTDFLAAEDQEFYYPLNIGGFDKEFTYVTINVLRASRDSSGSVQIGLYGNYHDCDQSFDSINFGNVEVSGFNDYVSVYSSLPSYGKIEIPPCVYDPNQKYYLYVYNSDYTTPVKIVISVIDARDVAAGRTLTNGVPVMDTVSTLMGATYRYTPSNPTPTTSLQLEVYIDYDQLTKYNYGTQGYFYVYQTTASSSTPPTTGASVCDLWNEFEVTECDYSAYDKCVITVNYCDLERTNYQFVVFTDFHLQYASPLRYSIKVTQMDVLMRVQTNIPTSTVIHPGQNVIFSYQGGQLAGGEFVAIEISNPQASEADSVMRPEDGYNPQYDLYDVYLTLENPVGACPCSVERIATCSGWTTSEYQCTLVIPACDYSPTATYYLVVNSRASYILNTDNLGFVVTPRVMGSVGDTLSPNAVKGGSVRHNDVINFPIDTATFNLQPGESVQVMVKNIKHGAVNVFTSADGLITPNLIDSLRTSPSQCDTPTAVCGGTSSQCSFVFQPCDLAGSAYVAVQAAGIDQTMFEIVATKLAPTAAIISTTTTPIDNAGVISPYDTIYYTVTLTAADVAAGVWISAQAFPSQVTPVITQLSNGLCTDISRVGAAGSSTAIVSACVANTPGTYYIRLTSSSSVQYVLRVFKQATYTTTAAVIGNSYDLQVFAGTTISFTTPSSTTDFYTASFGIPGGLPSSLEWYIGEGRIPCVSSVQYSREGGIYQDSDEYSRYGGINVGSIDPCCLKPSTTYFIYIVNYAALYDFTGVQQVPVRISITEYAHTAAAISPTPIAVSNADAGELYMHSSNLSPTIAAGKVRILTVDSVSSNAGGNLYWDINAPAGSGSAPCYTYTSGTGLYTGTNAQTNVMMYPAELCDGALPPAYFSVEPAVQTNYRISITESVITSVPLSQPSSFNVLPGATEHRKISVPPTSNNFVVVLSITVPNGQNSVYAAVNLGALASPGFNTQNGACILNTGSLSGTTVSAGNSANLTVGFTCETENQDLYYSITSLGSTNNNNMQVTVSSLVVSSPITTVTLSTGQTIDSGSVTAPVVYSFTVQPSSVQLPKISTLKFTVAQTSGSFNTAILYGDICSSAQTIGTCNSFSSFDSCDASTDPLVSRCDVRPGVYTVVVTPSSGTARWSITANLQEYTAVTLTLDQTLADQTVSPGQRSYFVLNLQPTDVPLGQTANILVNRDTCSGTVSFGIYNFALDGCPSVNSPPTRCDIASQLNDGNVNLFGPYVVEAIGGSLNFPTWNNLKLDFSISTYLQDVPVVIERILPFEEYKYTGAMTSSSQIVLSFPLTQWSDNQLAQDYTVKVSHPDLPTGGSYRVSFDQPFSCPDSTLRSYDYRVPFSTWSGSEVMYIEIDASTLDNTTFTVVPRRPLVREVEAGKAYQGAVGGYYYSNDDVVSQPDVELFHIKMAPSSASDLEYSHRTNIAVNSYSGRIDVRIYVKYSAGTWYNIASYTSRYSVNFEENFCGGSGDLYVAVSASASSGGLYSVTGYSLIYSEEVAVVDELPLGVPVCDEAIYPAHYYSVPPPPADGNNYRLRFRLTNDDSNGLELYLSKNALADPDCSSWYVGYASNGFIENEYVCSEPGNVTLAVAYGSSGNYYTIWAQWEMIQALPLTDSVEVSDRSNLDPHFANYDIWTYAIPAGTALDYSVVQIWFTGPGRLYLSTGMVAGDRCGNTQYAASYTAANSPILLFACDLQSYNPTIFLSAEVGGYTLQVKLITVTSTVIDDTHDALHSITAPLTPALFEFAITSASPAFDTAHLHIGSVRGANLMYKILTKTQEGCYSVRSGSIGSSDSDLISLENTKGCGLTSNTYMIWFYTLDESCRNTYYRLSVDHQVNPGGYSFRSLQANTPLTVTDIPVGGSDIFELPAISTFTSSNYLTLEIRDVSSAAIFDSAAGAYAYCPLGPYSNYNPFTYPGMEILLSCQYSYSSTLYVRVSVPQSSYINQMVYSDATFTLTPTVKTLTPLVAGTAATGTLATYNNAPYADVYQYTFPANSEQTSKTLKVDVSAGHRVDVSVTSCSCGISKDLICYKGESCYLEVSQAAEDFSSVYCNDFIVIVSGTDAAYSVLLEVGSANCEPLDANTAPMCANALSGTSFLPGSGSSSVQYFKHEDAAAADAFAYTTFLELYDNVQCGFSSNGQCPCEPVTEQCNITLMRFACAETFSRCDADGFMTPACSGLCENVQRDCGIDLSDIGGRLSQSCGSSSYGQAFTDECTGCVYDVCGNCNPVGDVTDTVDACGVCGGDGSTCASSVASSVHTAAAVLLLAVVAFVL